MTTTSPNQISLDEFLKHKTTNREMLPELVEFYNTNKNRFNKVNNHWRKFDQKQDQYKQDDQYKQSENWLVANKFKQNDEEKLYSQFRSILNKLSNSNFDNLAKELTTLEIGKSEHLAKLAEFIFNKAIIESKFAVMYAKLAKELSGYSIKEEEKMIYFRELLINKCQIMFNDCLSYTPDVSNKTLITKEIAVGCMIFIGELYNIELLTNKIINSCFLLLLVNVGQNKDYIVDCVCALVRTAGNTFIQKSNNEAIIVLDKIEKIIMNTVELSKRDRFALKDIIDLKKVNGW